MKALVADDDPISLQRLRSFMEKQGFETLTCGDGNAAWELVQRDDSISVYILDWMMPGMDGVELCRRIRAMEAKPYRYVIMLTAKDGRDDLVAGMEAGADDYVTKPFYPQELTVRLRAARRILEFSKELMEARDLLYQQAMVDGLTGALNRSAAMRRLEEEWDRSSRQGTGLGIIMMDLDHFKKINDTHGHLAGDQVLRETVRRIKSALREYDILGRYGGEEFIVALPQVDLESGRKLAERLHWAIGSSPMNTTEGIIRVTASMGLTVITGFSGLTAGQAIGMADCLLYEAKNGGRDRVIADSGGKYRA